jgi:hypothetical protein
MSLTRHCFEALPFEGESTSLTQQGQLRSRTLRKTTSSCGEPAYHLLHLLTRFKLKAHRVVDATHITPSAPSDEEQHTHALPKQPDYISLVPTHPQAV